MGNSEIDSRKAVFLDRDGVITANVYYEKWGELEAPMCSDDVELLPEAIAALLKLQNNFSLFIVSNQAAYAKGKTTLRSLITTADSIEKDLASAGVEITESYYSYTHPNGIMKGFSGNSLERKPGTYFLQIAAARYDIDLPKSWMIGDRETDIICGKNAGCRTIRIAAPSVSLVNPSSCDYFASSLLEAADIILKLREE